MKIAILGAGVGGLSTAIALHRAGFEVHVYEQRPSVTALGAGIVIWPNASYVLHELELLDKIAIVSGNLSCMQRFSHQGEALGTIDITLLNKLMGYPSLSILRKDLMNVLVTHLSEIGVDVKYRHRVNRLSCTDSGNTRIEFDNGLSIQADLVVGADGRMNSVARSFVNNDNSPKFQGFVNWVGVYDSNNPLFTDMAIRDIWGVGKRFGIVPVSAYKAYWAAAIAVPAIDQRPPTLHKDEVWHNFSHWPRPIPTIVANTALDDINKIYVHDHDPIDNWHKSNVLLIGDAAHAPLPTSGQGACQALEDAWLLAELLAESDKPLHDICTTFTRYRHAKTTSISVAARQLASSLFNTDTEYCEKRNQASKTFDHLQTVKGMAKIWSNALPIEI